jgi:hypothetical protein
MIARKLVAIAGASRPCSLERQRHATRKFKRSLPVKSKRGQISALGKTRRQSMQEEYRA